MNRTFVFIYSIVLGILISSCQTNSKKSIIDKVNDREYPSIFQAWYGIDMPEEWPVSTNEQRIKMASQHDLLWEEPLSQLGEGVELVLGLKWEGKYDGLATKFDSASYANAKLNKEKLLKLNPNMIHLFEIRWRDAPSTFLPLDSKWWLRDENNEIMKGWLGGWVPFYLLNYDNPEFQDNVARQAKIACESGIYDGVMLDWSGHLEIVKKIRTAIGSEKLIIVNVHDDIEDGEKFKDYINGSFMELNPIDSLTIPVEELIINDKADHNQRQWDKIRDALIWFEENFQYPQINCLEVWGNRSDLKRMRATTTLGLVYSNGYQLYADPNPLKTPDHYHDWYSFWDVSLGKPLSKYELKNDGSAWREFEKGTVVYNHYGNGNVTIQFKNEVERISDHTIGKTFTISDRDGDIFIKK